MATDTGWKVPKFPHMGGESRAQDYEHYFELLYNYLQSRNTYGQMHIKDEVGGHTIVVGAGAVDTDIDIDNYNAVSAPNNNLTLNATTGIITSKSSGKCWVGFSVSGKFTQAARVHIEIAKSEDSGATWAHLDTGGDAQKVAANTTTHFSSFAYI